MAQIAQLTSLFDHPLLWLALAALAVGLAFIALRSRLPWWPAWLTRVLLAALLLPGMFLSVQDFHPQEVPTREVLLVDQSDSLEAGTRQDILQRAREWQSRGTDQPNGETSARGENRLLVLFGANAEAALSGQGEVSSSERVPTVESNPPDPSVPATGGSSGGVDGRASDLTGALRLAESLLDGAPGKVYLASDGLAARPAEVDRAAARLARAGATLDVLPLAPRPAENDLALGSLAAPKNLWAGSNLDLLVPVTGAGAGPVQLTLTMNGQETNLSPEPVGTDSYRFRLTNLPEGIVTLQVTGSSPAASEPDPQPGNNSAFAVLHLFAPPRVGLVTSEPNSEAAFHFQQTLSDNGIQVDRIAAEDLPTNLADLQAYRVIFLDNLLSSQLSREQIQALQVFVSKLAGGLVVLGGRNSYTLGGYQDTLLAPMLPVKMEPPPRTKRAAIVFQLVLDRSSSMRVDRSGSYLVPMALAREAAMRAIETLRPEDYLGVLTFSDESQWAVPLRSIGGPDGLQQALDAVSQVSADGTTYMYDAMQQALAAVLSLPAGAPANRHILLLSDGQSTDGSPGEFEHLAQLAHEAGITVSTVALGEGADHRLMSRIADASQGRYYAVNDASELPRILISESQAARSENVQNGETSLKVGEAGHPILSGMSMRQLPTLSGYNALQSKAAEGAEDVLLSSSFDDPILSAWQYGLGRVAAWMGDIGGEWIGSWPEGGEGQFWSQVVRYVLLDPGLSPAQVNVQVEPTRIVVEGAIDTPDGEPLNLSDVTFTYATPQNETFSYRMTQKSAGIYGLEIPRPPEGAYPAILTYPGPNGERIEVPAPFAVNPPAEWQPPVDPSAGRANLAAWASAAGGKELSVSELLGAGLGASGAEPGGQEANTNPGLDWVGRLLLALVILWPLEIAVRRRWLPWK